MDDKLIFRAAVAYHKLLVSMAQKNQASANFPHHISQVKNLMHEISAWTQRLEIAEAKNWKSAIYFLKHNMINGLVKRVANNFAVMESELSEQNEICVPSIRELWQEIKSVNGLFDDCQYRKNCLSIVTKPITLKHHDITIKFGRFRIIIDFKANLEHNSCENLIYMEALEPNYPPAEEGLIHPHAREGDPCLGEAIGLIQTPFMIGQIESVFLILNSMLKTYNPVSPYRTMEEWYEEEEYVCDICSENVVNEDELYCCNKCSISMCDQCSMYCDECNENYCASCMGNTCGWCEEHVCDGCNNKCKGCGMKLCNSCTHQCCGTYCEDCSPTCKLCDNQFCPECESAECVICNTIYCENCLLECEICGAITCDNCGNTCSKCNDSICSECTRDCENCGKEFCKNCIDEDDCSLLKEKVK